MEEQKERGMRENKIHEFYFVRFPPSPVMVQKQEFLKQHQLLNSERFRINEELAQKKGEELEINQKLMRFSYLDKQLEWKTLDMKYLERYNQDTATPSVPINSTTKPDRKCSHKRLIKKGRMDIEFLQQVQEEHLSFQKSSRMTSNSTQELDDMIESMVQRIQHGNKKRADEMKIYQEIKNFKKTKEIVISQQPNPQSNQIYIRGRSSKRDTDWKRYRERKTKILLDDIENKKWEQIRRRATIIRLKTKLGQLRKSTICLNNKLKNVDLKRIEAYKTACEFLGQKEEMNSSYQEYQSLKTCVKEVARKGDLVELRHVCDIQVEKFMRQWSNNKAFREDYEKRILVLKQYAEGNSNSRLCQISLTSRKSVKS